MANIFCLCGKTGSGKSTLVKEVLRYYNNLDILNPLIYCTTRNPRKDEINSIDYYFYSDEEYKKINKNEFIDDREYNTKDNGISHYFTLKKNIKDYKNYICACSSKQYFNYKEYIDKNNISYINLVLLYIDCNNMDRIIRILSSRKTNDKTKDDLIVLEVCRRIIADEDDYKDILSIINKNNIIENNNINDSLNNIINIINNTLRI